MQPDQPRQSNPTSMEGRLAIFTEKWIVALVRVHSIRVTDRYIRMRIQCISTQGLYGKYEIGIGCIPEYLQVGNDIWVDRGFCRWRVFFAPALIEEVLAIAASFPKDWVYDPADADFDERYAALMKPLREYQRREAPLEDLEAVRDR